MIIIKTYMTNKERRGFIAYNTAQPEQSVFLPLRFEVSDIDQMRDAARLLIRDIIGTPLEAARLCRAKIKTGYAFTY